jgi:Rrf2 family protein
MMKISTRVRYGLRAAVELALRGAWRGSPGRPVPLTEVVKRQRIPEPYLRQIFFSLRRSKLLEAVMGKGGGYRLSREPGKITVYDILRGLGEEVAPVPCLLNGRQCEMRPTCPTHPLWVRMAEMLKASMRQTTVEALSAHCPGRGRLEKAGARGRGPDLEASS